MKKYPDLGQMIEDIETAVSVGSRRGGIDLNHREERFLAAMKDALATSRPVTEKQLDELRVIWDSI